MSNYANQRTSTLNRIGGSTQKIHKLEIHIMIKLMLLSTICACMTRFAAIKAAPVEFVFPCVTFSLYDVKFNVAVRNGSKSTHLAITTYTTKSDNTTNVDKYWYVLTSRF